MDEFEALYRSNVNAIFRYTLHSVGRSDVAEDITSEVFLELHRNRERIRTEQVSHWLFAVARNRVLDYRRRSTLEQRYMTPSVDPEDLPDAAGPESVVEDWLRDSKALKPVHRLCLTLRYLHGMSLREIARKTGMGEMQIKGYLQYGRQLLKKELLGEPE